MIESRILTGEQFRMAKAALGLANPQVAEMTGLHRNTLNKADKGDATDATWALIKLTLEAAGIEFIPENGGGPGVRLKKD
ncbi:DNA-binding XRE family transcriptional regulator [Labrenzia sp. EL_208]|nr:DNA-binding XRE family transcriptional regulator [Labrenzia sp. EL_132]MBG6233391.1 DNA-binding XRE family transcriptional regulator [Labrenzia sp. EL_208]